ncbi:MAG: lipoprotein [Pseudomonadota bacterium]
MIPAALPLRLSRIALLLSVLLLTACGQMGPLYQPAPEPPPATENNGN